MAKIQWSEARSKYISDITVSYHDIAKEFKVNYTTVAKWAKKENWIGLRQKAQQKADKKAIEKVGDSIAEVNSRHIKSARLLQETGIKPIENKKYKPRSFDQALRSLDKGIEIERKALGIDKPATPIGPTQPNTLINYNVFLQKYGDKRTDSKLPNGN